MGLKPIAIFVYGGKVSELELEELKEFIEFAVAY
jgi:hypothetical protein